MALTTVARVKALAPQFSDSSEDARLTVLIDSVSRAVEEVCGRGFLYVARTAIFDLRTGDSRFFLKGYPEAVITDIRYDQTQVWGNDTILDNTNKGRYVYDSETGCVVFHTPWAVDRAQCLKVTYTGGFDEAGEEADSFAGACADVAVAVAHQVLWEWKRIKMPGVGSASAHGASMTVDGAFSTIGTTRGLLPEVYDRVKPYITTANRR